MLDRDGVEPYVLGLAAAAVVQALLTGVGRQLTAKLGETVLAELREQVVERALAIPAARLERAGSGDLLSRVSNDVATVSTAIRTGVPELLQAGLFVGLTLFGLAALNPWLALAALPAVPIQLLGLRHYLKHVVPLYSHQRVQEGERTQRLIGAITGAKTSRALGLGALRRDEVETTSLAAVDTALRAARLQSDRFGRAMNGGELVGLASVLITGFLLVRAGNATVGEATAAALYFHRAFDPVGHAVRARRRLPGGGVRAHAPDRRDDARRRAAAARDRRHAGDHGSPAIHHAYVDEHPVLHGIDLQHRARRAGRADRHHRRGQDDDRADRRRARTADARARSRSAGTSGSSRRRCTSSRARSPPTCGWPSPTPPTRSSRHALDQAGASWGHELLETHVGEGGHALTAAQAQQVALARLALHDPPVAILDEAGAEAGSAGARTLETAAQRVLDGRTALVIAHRLTQASTADRIVVLEHGLDRRAGHARAIAREQGQIRATLGGLARLDSPQWSGGS